MQTKESVVGSHALIIAALKRLLHQPGVYLFKNDQGEVLYVGKAKDLKKRGAQYIQSLGSDVKTDLIFELSSTVDCTVTGTELEALLLEAKLIQSHQPRCNVLLKTGQPFTYIFVPAGEKLLELQLVRNQKQKGTHFGPFIDKAAARRVFDFLVKTFRLKLCKKHIANGCLFYHLGLCAGSCRPDFDRAGYLERLELAKMALKQGHKKFLVQLQEQIKASNQLMTFEKSRELHGYFQAFEHVFFALNTKSTDVNLRAGKHVWVLSGADLDERDDGEAWRSSLERRQGTQIEHGAATLYVLAEREGVLRKKHVFLLPVGQPVTTELLGEYVRQFYTAYTPPATVLVNFDLGDDTAIFQDFFQQWHELAYTVEISNPASGHFANVVRLAVIQVQQEQLKQRSLASQLKQLLKLPNEPHSIDCFDISHKQGMFMVGSCVRFVDGKPDKNSFRKFHIKTVNQIDDYASLREVVSRRYHDRSQLPDLILIDGGKGQLSAVVDLFPEAEFISLAKREETVFSRRLPAGKILDQKSYVGQVLMALRDYAHHFAISFHQSLENLDQ